MYSRRNSSLVGLWFVVLTAGMLLCQTGCQTTNSSNAGTGTAQAALTPERANIPGVGQELFASDDAAAAALLAAVKAQDHAQLHKIFGPAIKELSTGDKVEDHRHFEDFVAHAQQKFWLEKQSANTSIVHVGDKNWPFPIPITRLPDGRWFFNTVVGKQEILARHIGADELKTIKVCAAYVEAQRQYASAYHDGSDVLQYAQRLVSKPGTPDGLYWPAAAGQAESPFGPLAAQAAAEGYKPGKKAHQGPHPFFGYYFRILTQQGPAAPGGAYNYIINGNMIAGCALVAFPATYRASGVMTFIVNQQGKIYQKDLGQDTISVARKMTTYNPDASWTLVQQ
ncbi:MAG: DUF2950 domain-containing protein [Phycisphaerales bacterium]|nr:DUF2950 domain-containing protein [Phycisphaerales bacterium]